MIKILFVCLGNICRSPTAEGVFRHKASEEGLTDIMIDSAGTAAYHIGNPPDKRSQHTASKYGIDLSTLRARQVAYSDYTEFDYIIAMDNENLRNMQSECPGEHRHKLFKFTEFCDRHVGEPVVPDPYYGGSDGFEKTFSIIEDAAEGFLNHIKREHNL
ncbi:low molecular weight protein-tyrosine-phosphatase [Pseudemcibacter aquimaris]|uniref:low molecular weight protein-tyrosine-phosphatase n=1 Tax=Pseudemcibacter aquimaris TaxID=2857064 RepID=UPI0020117653|nr:low molecular weight protein-tyrosine-phosphatase [Pseudemcibacter aquimaris]MCC3862239.1 low molecular weight phosphotyrosine protein phosphatase [Pseudemcibacter aquimaris]WDU58991.1 low molecular weight phosphotyrosine protein phosphatase [Pseudemcibacter aquimaris]